MLQNGYYLSTYVAINELSNLTNFALRGDQNISLWRVDNHNVELIHYWELERLTGQKGHDRSFVDIKGAKRFINELLEDYDLTLEDINEVWGTPQLDTCSDYHSLEEYPEISYHSVAHLFSSLLLDTDIFYNSKILAVAVDGGPDMVVDKEKDNKDYYSGCYAEKGVIKNIFSICSPGPLWSAAKNIFDMREGTLMALQSATRCEVNDLEFVDGKAKEIVSANEVPVDLENYIKEVDKAFQEKKYHDYDDDFSEKENKISMCMKEINKQSLKMMDETIEHSIKKFGINPAETYFAITGGYGLNCPANTYFMHKYNFKGFIAPPCINDTGLSLGIALYAFYKKMGKFIFKFRNAFYGNTDIMSQNELKANYGRFINKIEKYKPEDVADDVMCEPVIWFQGAAEIGPRALGHRSILANPCSMKSKERLNQIKKRQWWRPVAPIVLEEELNNWFENAFFSPYMLHTFRIKEEKRDEVPAIEHLDSTCRVQTINKEQDSLIYNVVKKIYEKYGIPIVCNTSLNDIGEPIIDSIDQAMNFALRKGIKIIYINDFRIELKNHSDYKETTPAERRYEKEFIFSSAEIEERLGKINPLNLPKDQLAVYLYSPQLFERLDLKKKNDARMIKMLTEMAKNEHPTIAYGGINTGCS